MEISRQEYVAKKRKRVFEIATGMLNGSVNYLEGAIELSSLMLEVDVPESAPDFEVFKLIESEVDNLPIGPPRQYWLKKTLEQYEPEVRDAINWAKKVSLSECKSLQERFRT